MNYIYRKYFLLTMFLFGLMVLGCKELPPEPDPAQSNAKADFITEPFSRVVVNDTMIFIDKSVNAAKIEWDFADGQKSNSPIVKKVYNSPGAYRIKLTAFDENNKSSTYFKSVFIGYHHISSLKINKISFTDSTGVPWTPDNLIRLQLNIVSETYSVTNQVSFDNQVSPNTLPIFKPFSENKAKISPHEYAYALNKNKISFELYEITNPVPRLMKKWTIDPTQDGILDSRQGSYTLSDPNYEISFDYYFM